MVLSFNQHGAPQSKHGPFSSLPLDTLGTPLISGWNSLLQSASFAWSPPRASIHDSLRDHIIVQTIPAVQYCRFPLHIFGAAFVQQEAEEI
jgi:hypothetical protein